MIRTATEASESYEFASQFFFDDALTDRVYTQEPYAGKGQHNTRNDDYNIYKNGGDQLVLNFEGGNTNDYTATINIRLDLTDAEVRQPDTFQGGESSPP